MCLIVSALVGLGAAGASVVFGLGVLVAFLVYSATSSLAVVLLSLAMMPRRANAPRPALRPAPMQHTA